MCQKFDVTRNFENFWELNRASILYKKKQSSRLLLLVGAGLDWVWQHPCISRSDACGPEFTYQYPESKSGIWWCPPLPHQECLWMSTIRHSRSKYIRIFCFWDEYIRVYWHAFASRLKGLCIERTPCCRETLCMHACLRRLNSATALPARGVQNQNAAVRCTQLSAGRRTNGAKRQHAHRRCIWTFEVGILPE